MTKFPRYFVFAVPLIALVGLVPALLMSTSRGGSGAFFLLLLISLLSAIFLKSPTEGAFDGYRWLAACLAMTAVATIASQTAHGTWSGSEIERAIRLVVGILLTLAALRRLERPHLKYAVFGMVVACWLTTEAVIALSLQSNARPNTEEYNAVGYGNLMLLFGIMVVYSLAWKMTRYVKTEATIKLLTAAAVFYGFMLTQTRTGWMAVPVFILIGVALFNHRTTLRKGVLICLAIMLLAGAAGYSSSALRTRAELGVKELEQCQLAPLTDSSMCIRLQLWRAAWKMFTNEPIFGVGGGKQFAQHLKAEEQTGGVSRYVATNFGESHSDPLYALATNGLLGGLALLLAYLAPSWIFFRRLTQRGMPQEIRVAAAMGLAFCLGFAVFGLTELMFRGMRTVSFYAICVAWFLAASHSATPRHALPDSQSS
jgi:O-antigen ligase